MSVPVDGGRSTAYERLAVESIEQAERELDPARRNKLFQIGVWWALFGKADADLNVRLN